MKKLLLGLTGTILFASSSAFAAQAVNCDVIIPYQWGKMLHVQAECHKIKNPGMRLICINACKSACTQTAQECSWDLADKLACWQGCQDGPLLPKSGVLEELGGSAEELL